MSRRGRWAALRHGELPAPKARWRSPPTPEIRPATQERGSEGESSWLVRMMKLSVRSRPLGHRDGLPDPERRWDAPLCRCPSWGHHLLSHHIEVPVRHRRPRGGVHRRSDNLSRPGTGEWVLWSRGKVHEGPEIKCNMV